MKLIENPPQRPLYINDAFIMSSPTVLTIRSSSTQFAPQKLEIASIGKTSVLLYPKGDASMADPEKAMAFQQHKTALASADLDQKVCILALAD